MSKPTFNGAWAVVSITHSCLEGGGSDGRGGGGVGGGGGGGGGGGERASLLLLSVPQKSTGSCHHKHQHSVRPRGCCQCDWCERKLWLWLWLWLWLGRTGALGGDMLCSDDVLCLWWFRFVVLFVGCRSLAVPPTVRWHANCAAEPEEALASSDVCRRSSTVQYHHGVRCPWSGCWCRVVGCCHGCCGCRPGCCCG